MKKLLSLFLSFLAFPAFAAYGPQPENTIVQWPASGNVCVSNNSNIPASVAPVNGECLVGSGGAWTAGSCSSGSGTVTTSGSPASGNLTEFSGSTAITNGNLSGDVTTSGTLAATVAKVQGTTVTGGSGDLFVTTGGNTNPGICPSTLSGYNVLSVNGICNVGTSGGAIGLEGGATDDSTLYLLANAGGYSFRDNNANVFQISSAGAVTTGSWTASPVGQAYGGAGTISGALKGNGSGTVSQAACADLSNGATGCSTATGTSGATLPLNNANNTFSGNDTHSGTTLFTGGLPILANGNASVAASSTAGGLFTGQGSTSDVTIENKTGGSVCAVATGTTTLNCTGLQVGGVAVSTTTGTVTSFSAGALSPVFTTSVATATSTPALTFALTSATANSVFGNNTSGSAAPGYQTIIDLAGSIVSVPAALSISTATFTPAATGTDTARVVLVHASCPCTIANPSGTAKDGERLLLEVWQSATGNDLVTTWGSNYDFGTTGTPTLSTAANKGDVLGFSFSSQNSKWLFVGITQGL